MINYSYFRHRFDAHTSNKINALIDDMGLIGYAYYFTLLEIYGAKVANAENKDSAEIHLRVIANTWRKRVDTCRKVLTKLELSGLLVVTKSPLSCNLVVTKSNPTVCIGIPNFLKYYGSYLKKKDESSLIKEKKRKEKESEEAKVEIEPLTKSVKNKELASKISFIEKEYSFLGVEPRQWLTNATEKVLIDLKEKYDDQDLNREIDKAFDWNEDQSSSKKKKRIGAFLKGWLDRSNAEEKSESFEDGLLNMVKEAKQRTLDNERKKNINDTGRSTGQTENNGPPALL